MGTLSSSQREFLAESTARYSGALGGSPAEEYLRTVRGLSRDSLTSFRLGFVADPLPGHEMAAGRLAIPYLTPAGVTAMNFRRLGELGPKYWAEPGIKRPLFNVGAFQRHEPFLCVCEGEMDTIAVTQAGLPAVGVPGAQGWQPWFARCFRGYDAVFILADTDDKGAGLGLAEKVAAQVEGARIIPMPVGHDANSFLLEQGSQALYDLIGVTQ